VRDDLRAAGRSYSSVMVGMREYEDWQALGRELIARGLAASVLDALNAELVIVGVDEALAQRAGELALRGQEAVHLASALALGPGETILVTGDRELSNAAVGAGLAFAPVL
jgi:ABC-type branched-subunit amino acid transport system ATPase component